MNTEARLGLWANDRLEYRFCTPNWRVERRPVPFEQLRNQVRGLDAAVCRRLTVADATLSHPDFERVVLECRDAGLQNLALETDGRALASDGMVRTLEELGFDKVFIVVGGMRRRVHERVMREEGFVEAFQGIAQAAAASFDTYVVAPIIRWTESDLVALLDYLLEMSPRPTGLLPFVPVGESVPSAFRPLLLSHSRQAALAAQLFETCTRRHMEFGFFTKRGLLPCATQGALDRYGTVFFERLSRLRHDSGPQPTRVEACQRCSLSQTCPGVDPVYLEQFGADELQAVPLEVSMGWKLRPINRLDERGVKGVSAFENDVESHGRSLVRVNGHCNMSCSFCYIDRTVPDFEAARLERAIEDLAARNRDHLVLSGGEPTLHPALPELVARAKRLGFREIEIQSNGVRSADEAYASGLVEAGLTKATMSLHSVDPEHSDRITRLPGAFAKTVRAIHNYRALGILTQIAHVITKSNFQDLPKTVRFLREEFPSEGGSLSICFGIAQPISDLVYTWVMPRFEEVAPYMREALDYCLETGLGFGGMIGQGGYPPCMVGGDLRYYERNLGHIYRSEDHGEQFYKADRCRRCSFDPWCLGVRRYYVDVYGDAEIRPFDADVSAIAVPPVPAAPKSSGPDPRGREQLVTLGRRPAS